MREYYLLLMLGVAAFTFPDSEIIFLRRGLDLRRNATPHLLDGVGKHTYSDQYHGGVSLDQRSLQRRQTTEEGKNDKRASSSSSSLDEEVVFKPFGLPDDSDSHIIEKGQAPAEKDTGKKKKTKRRKKAKNKNKAQDIQGTNLEVTGPEEFRDRQSHDKNTGQINVNSARPHRVRVLHGPINYWDKILKYQQQILSVESLLHDPGMKAAQKHRVGSERPFAKMRDEARSSLRNLESGLKHKSYFFAEVGTPHHKALVERAEKFVKECTGELEQFQKAEMNEQFAQTIPLFKEMLSDGGRRLDQLQAGEIPHWSSRESSRASTDSSLTSTEQRGMIEEVQQELDELEKRLRDARAAKQPSKSLNELRTEIRNKKEFLQEMKDGFARGETRGPGMLSRFAKPKVSGQEGSSKNLEKSRADHLQSEILEAQRLLQEANLRWQNARKERWPPEMVGSLKENVKDATRRLDTLQKSAQEKGKQLDKRWLGGRHDEKLAFQIL